MTVQGWLIAFGVIGIALLIALRRVNARRCNVFDEETLKKLGDLADKEEK